MTGARLDQRLVTVLGFVIACLLGLAFLWVKAGGNIPVVAAADDYRVSFVAGDIKNLRDQGEVRIAGVEVGTIESRRSTADGVEVVLSLNEDAAPLHEGVTVRVGIKSLVGASYVDVVDGDGKELPGGTELSAQDVVAAVDVDELYDTLDEPTQESLSASVQSLGQATQGRGEDVDRVMSGLDAISDEGATTLEAIAAQGEDLKAVSVETRRLLDALDTGRGQIATMVSQAKTLTDATAAKDAELRQTVRALPLLVTSLRTGATKLGELAVPLGPIATDLRAAAPDLNRALINLPPTTRDLDALVPDLDATLSKVPATLDAVPAFDQALADLIPQAQTTLRDVNPMLAYLEPYGLDLGGLFAGFSGSFDEVAEDGIMPLRLMATAEGFGSVSGNPVTLPDSPLFFYNPYPAPLSADKPSAFRGQYPKVERAPR